MKRWIAPLTLVILWSVLALVAWFGPDRDISEAERRPLAQMPAISAESLLDGSFMKDFETYSLDQFPLRDAFRRVKSVWHYYVLQQRDNNGIYIAEGHAAETVYPLKEDSLDHALKQFEVVYDSYLKDSGSRVLVTVVPDKGYYLAESSGHLTLDYQALFDHVQQEMSYAQWVDITDCLSTEDYYTTDLHWRQEKLLKVADRLCEALDVTSPGTEDYTPVLMERPFYGVYCGQAALPLQSDELYILESPILENCRVYNYVTDAYTDVYDMGKLNGRDMYDVYLSGAQSLLRIENPAATTDRELMVFRDSFGSSLVPLLVQDYAAVTLVDIRYIQPQVLGKYLEFTGQDVLFMYSSLVLNKNLI